MFLSDFARKWEKKQRAWKIWYLIVKKNTLFSAEKGKSIETINYSTASPSLCSVQKTALRVVFVFWNAYPYYFLYQHKIINTMTATFCSSLSSLHIFSSNKSSRIRTDGRSALLSINVHHQQFYFLRSQAAQIW